jgi:type I restriction enzyme S subunit
MSWQKAKLKDLGWLRSAGVNKLSEPNQNEVRLLNYMDIYRNQKISNDIDFQVVTAKDTEIKNANLEVGDILFTPSSEKPTDIGHAGIIIEELENTVYSYHLVRFRPDEPKKFNPHFLAYALNSFSSEKHFISRATGTTRYTLSKSDFQSLEFEYPENPAEQTAIATLFSKVDEAIAATQKSIKAAEKLKKALMQNLLTGKLKPDGTWRTEDEFYEDEKFGKVPKGWEMKRLKDVFFVNQDSLPSQTDSNFTFKYITIEAVETENIDFENCPEYAFKDSPGRARRIINDNDILISGVRPNLKAFAIYKKPNDENWICSTGFYVLTAKEDENHKYHFYQILSEIGEKQFHSYVAGSNYPAIGDRDLKLLKLLRPPYDEQCLIVDKFDYLSKENAAKQTKILTLQRLKKSLMQNLLTGKIRLSAEFIEEFENSIEEINKIEQ